MRKDDGHETHVTEITVSDIIADIQAFRRVQEYIKENIDDADPIYKDFDVVLMRATESIADIADEKGFNDISELEDNMDGYFTCSL